MQNTKYAKYAKYAKYKIQNMGSKIWGPKYAKYGVRSRNVALHYPIAPNAARFNAKCSAIRRERGATLTFVA